MTLAFLSNFDTTNALCALTLCVVYALICAHEWLTDPKRTAPRPKAAGRTANQTAKQGMHP